MEQVTEENERPAREAVVIDRVTLGKEAAERLDHWLEQIQNAFNGLIKLNKSDLVNYLVSEHKTDLAKKELKKLKSTHFDQVKFAAWALNRLKEAQKNGESLTYADLVRLQNSMGKLESAPTADADKPRKSKKRKDADTIDLPFPE